MPTTTVAKRQSYYEELRQRGYSRRDFMKFCTTIAAYLGLEASGVSQVSKAMMTNPRVPVI
jgi:hydrogenase small subunit